MNGVRCRWLVSVAVMVAAPLRVSGQVAEGARRAVAVSMFEVRGYTRDPGSLGARAAVLTEALRRALGGDSTVRALSERPEDRPRDPRTGRVPAVHHFVFGTIEEGGPGAFVVTWHVRVVEDGRILAGDTLRMAAGRETDVAALLARRIGEAIRREVAPEPSPG